MMNFSKRFLTCLMAAAAFTLTAAAFSKTNTYTDGMFTDVPAEQWYASEVKSTYELGLMQGVGGGLFQPDGNVTVAEAVQNTTVMANQQQSAAIFTEVVFKPK